MVTIEAVSADLATLTANFNEHLQTLQGGVGHADFDARLQRLEAGVMTSVPRTEVDQNMGLVRQAIDKLEADVRAFRTGSGKTSTPLSMTSRRAFGLLTRYAGRADQFDDWRFAVTNFLEEEPAFHGFLRELEQRKGVKIQGDHLDYWQSTRSAGEELPNAAWLDQQLYQVLVQNCVGEALAIVRTYADEEARRANAWRAVLGEAIGFTGNRFQCVVARVFSPKRVQKYGDAIQTLSNWETLFKEFEAGSGVTPNSTPSALKVHAVMQLVPAELEKHMRLMGYQLRPYAEAKDYIIQQVEARKEAHFEKPNAGAAPMEIDAMIAQLQAQKDQMEGSVDETGQQWQQDYGEREDGSDEQLMAFRKGGGKGKGQKGNCYNCGQPGHIAVNCPQKGGKSWQKGGGKAQSQFPYNCHHCGEKGHMQRDCPKGAKGYNKGTKGQTKGGYQGGYGGYGKGGYGVHWLDSSSDTTLSNVVPGEGDAHGGAYYSLMASVAKPTGPSMWSGEQSLAPPDDASVGETTGFVDQGTQAVAAA